MLVCRHCECPRYRDGKIHIAGTVGTAVLWLGFSVVGIATGRGIRQILDVAKAASDLSNPSKLASSIVQRSHVCAQCARPWSPVEKKSASEAGCATWVVIAGAILAGVTVFGGMIAARSPSTRPPSVTTSNSNKLILQSNPVPVNIILPPIKSAKADKGCGKISTSPPRRMDSNTWRTYNCLNKHTTGTKWKKCLPRKTYSSDRADGCPSNLRYCPP